MLFDLQLLQQSILSLRSSILLLVLLKNLLDVLAQILWVNLTRHSIIRSKLIHNHLVFKVVSELVEHIKRERMTVISLQATVDLVLLGQRLECQLELNLIPVHHGWHVIVVLCSVHILLSYVAVKLLVQLGNQLAVDDLIQLLFSDIA